MTAYKTRKIKTSLEKKGFCSKEGRSRHIKYTLYVNGKKTRIYTWISHGDKEYGDRLLNAMRKELHLENSEELKRFIECPMSGEEFVTLLTKRNVIKI